MPATDARRIHMLLAGPSEAELRQRIPVIPRAELSQTCAKHSGFLCMPWCWAASLYPLLILLSSSQLLILPHDRKPPPASWSHTAFSEARNFSACWYTLRHCYLLLLRQLWTYISWGKTSKHPSKMPSLFGIDAQPETRDFYCNPNSFPLCEKFHSIWKSPHNCCPFPSPALFFWNHRLRRMYFIRERNKGKRQISTPSFFPCHCCSLRAVVPTLLAASGAATPDMALHFSLGGSLDVGHNIFQGRWLFFHSIKAYASEW